MFRHNSVQIKICSRKTPKGAHTPKGGPHSKGGPPTLQSGAHTPEEGPTLQRGDHIPKGAHTLKGGSHSKGGHTLQRGLTLQRVPTLQRGATLQRGQILWRRPPSGKATVVTADPGTEVIIVVVFVAYPSNLGLGWDRLALPTKQDF